MLFSSKCSTKLCEWVKPVIDRKQDVLGHKADISLHKKMLPTNMLAMGDALH